MGMIKFRHGGGWKAAELDGRIFKLWEMGEIDTFDAAYEIAVNNGINHVSERDFVETANSLGYWRDDGERLED